MCNLNLDIELMRIEFLKNIKNYKMRYMLKCILFRNHL